MTRALIAAGFLLASTALAASACDEPTSLEPPTGSGGGAPIACGDCPANQKCHFVDGECIYAGIAVCESCAGESLCSPAYPEPTCVKGTCAPPSAFGDGTVKLVSLAVASEERGCDLDGDGDPDNRFASVIAQVDLNGELADAIEADLVTMLLEPTDPTWGDGGKPFGASLWFGTLSAQSKQCSTTSPEALCTYTVSRASYDPASLDETCATWLRFRDLARSGAEIASPTPGVALDMVVPVGGGGWLLQLLGARLDAVASQAAVEGPGLGPKLAGRLCAAVPKADLLLAVDTLPAETTAKFGGAEVVKKVVDGIVEADVDADGDGDADSVSLALEWTSVPARIVGYSPKE
ncbi:MAG: hypothetical protein FJ095_19500 [Deltaproteobacteria bacterium]|nr:hypothetical protein [Deltaproteobacteria bacterium]